MTELKEFHVTASIRYSGRQEVNLTINAVDQKEAEAKFDNIDLDNLIDTWGIDYDVDSFECWCDEDKEPIMPRCDKTKDMFAAFIFIAISLLNLPAHAAEINSVVLPVRATIIQCGPRAKLVEACIKDERCCGLIEPDAGSEQETENPDNLQYEIEQWPGRDPIIRENEVFE